MTDDFKDHSTSLTSPATAGETIVPDDANDLAHVTRGIYVGASGSIALTLVSGDEVLLNDAQSGVIYPLRVARVKATGTSAAGLIGLR
ncbi:MAG: hypothetical protein AAGB18_01680 [Pseudomonadota bacterium]